MEHERVVGSCAPVSNIPIWEMMLSDVEREGHEVLWVKVPSHVTVEGTNEVDRIASVSLQMHPLYPFMYPFSNKPHKEAFATCTPPPPVKGPRSRVHTGSTRGFATA